MLARLCPPLAAVGVFTVLAACGQPDAERAKSSEPELPPEWRTPARYQGEWHADLARCGDRSDESYLKIGPETLEFYESSGKVMASSTIEDQWTVVAEMTGEGMTWRRAYVFVLQEGDTALVFEDSGLVRYRCPEEG